MKCSFRESFQIACSRVIKRLFRYGAPFLHHEASLNGRKNHCNIFAAFVPGCFSRKAEDGSMIKPNHMPINVSSLSTSCLQFRQTEIMSLSYTRNSHPHEMWSCFSSNSVPLYHGNFQEKVPRELKLSKRGC